jgi:hypothetical protein
MVSMLFCLRTSRRSMITPWLRAAPRSSPTMPCCCCDYIMAVPTNTARHARLHLVLTAFTFRSCWKLWSGSLQTTARRIHAATLPPLCFCAAYRRTSTANRCRHHFCLCAISIMFSRFLHPQTCITRLWCSSRRLLLPEPNVRGDASDSSSSSSSVTASSFCSMLNCVLRDDDPPPLMHSCCCLVRTMRDACPVYAPSQGVSHRGCAMSSAALAFFSPGMKFRVPCFFSTCIDRDAALRHCRTAAAAAAAAAQQPVPVMWHIQCSRKSPPSFMSSCLSLQSQAHSPLAAPSRPSLLTSSRTPSRVSPARVSQLYNSSSDAGLGSGSINSDSSLEISLLGAATDEREVCHSALWLQGSDVFLFVPYAVFIVVAVRPSSSPLVFM